MNKQEAKELIKELRKHQEKDFHCLKHKISYNCCDDHGCKCGCADSSVLCNADYEASDSSGAIKVIKFMFNITEKKNE